MKPNDESIIKQNIFGFLSIFHIFFKWIKNQGKGVWLKKNKVESSFV